MSVVYWNPHLSWIAVVQTVSTAIVLVAPVVLRVGNIRVVVELVVVHARVLLSLLGFGIVNVVDCDERNGTRTNR